MKWGRSWRGDSGMGWAKEMVRYRANFLVLSRAKDALLKDINMAAFEAPPGLSAEAAPRGNRTSAV